MLDELGDKRAIAFVNTKTNVDMVAKNLDNVGYVIMLLLGPAGSRRSRGKLASKDLGPRGTMFLLPPVSRGVGLIYLMWPMSLIMICLEISKCTLILLEEQGVLGN